jgi:hypothetical protein
VGITPEQQTSAKTKAGVFLVCSTTEPKEEPPLGEGQGLLSKGWRGELPKRRVSLYGHMAYFCQRTQSNSRRCLKICTEPQRCLEEGKSEWNFHRLVSRKVEKLFQSALGNEPSTSQCLLAFLARI